MNISVCMATFNGAKFIKKQLESILMQIDFDDEIVVVDDYSSDNTINIINDFHDNRIRVYRNEKNLGHVFSFNKAIEISKNDIIFMSDQDDIWLNNRVEIMINCIVSKGIDLVSSNANYIDIQDNNIRPISEEIKTKTSEQYFKNIVKITLGKAPYYGCAMAFRKELKKLILPIPNYVESHDLWIAIAANIKQSNFHLEENTLSRRIHDNNASVVKRKFIPKLYSRYVFIISIYELLKRKKYISTIIKQANKNESNC